MWTLCFFFGGFVILSWLFTYYLFLFPFFSAKWASFLLGVSGGLTAVCVSFPFGLIHSSGGWDLRYLPLTLSTLYGRFTAWIPAIVLEMTYQLTLGKTEPFSFPMGVLGMTLLSLSFARVFRLYDKMQKILMITGLSLTGDIASLIRSSKPFLWNPERMVLWVRTQRMFFIPSVIGGLLVAILSVLLTETLINMGKVRSQLQQLQKLHVVSELAASIAHEVRNPLTVVRGFLQLIQEIPQDSHQRYIHTAIQELDRSESIISEYLNFARPHENHLSLFDVNKELHIICEIMHAFAAIHSVELTFEESNKIFLQGDPLKFKQALMNLIKNAIEAGSTHVTIHTVTNEGQMTIVITDNGHGMTRETLAQIGQPFHSAKERGTGLGLTVTLQLITDMKGEVRFDSDTAQGTQVILTFPWTENQF